MEIPHKKTQLTELAWEELPASVKLAINDSIGQANRGEFIPLAEVKKEVSALLKK